MNIKKGKRVRIKDPYLDNWYFGFFNEPEDDEFFDSFPSEVWTTVPDENREHCRRSNMRVIATLWTKLRANGEDFEDIFIKLQECVHPDALKTCEAGIFLQALGTFMEEE